MESHIESEQATALKTVSLIRGHLKILLAVTRIELVKRYSGSVLGKLWLVLYPLLLLSMYLFIYAVVFKVRFENSDTLHYALFVLSGLIPYLGFMDAISTGSLAIKQNIHLIRNVMLPIELVPVRYVLVSLAGQIIALCILALLIIVTGSATPGLLALPVVLIFEMAFLTGVLWILAPLATALPDVVYFINLFVLFLMFVSPIGFQPEMVPSGALQLVLLFNPVYYMVETYRLCLLRDYTASPMVAAGFGGWALFALLMGCLVFGRFKSVIADYE